MAERRAFEEGPVKVSRDDSIKNYGPAVDVDVQSRSLRIPVRIETDRFANRESAAIGRVGIVAAGRHTR